MNIQDTSIKGVALLSPKIFTDFRGYFFESFSTKKFRDIFGFEINFIQDNESESSYGVLRGLHFQRSPHSQSKLVRVVKGSILDVAVDIRRNSPTFMEHVAVELNEENKNQLFIPRGFAHGFVSLSANTIVSYKCDSYYNLESEACIRFDDPDLNIDWKIDSKDLILTDKDKTAPLLKEVELFDFNQKFY